MDPSTIYKKTESYVNGLFEQNFNPKLLYHNLQHTKTVVSRVKEIAGHYDLSERDMLILFVTAWFHDTGYLFAEPQLHEEKSVEIMRRFMADFTTDESLLQDIADCILATKGGATPQSLSQEIIRDADTYHVGTDDFKKMNKVVMAELKIMNPDFNKPEQEEKTVQWLEKHKFYTGYCSELLNNGKRKNLKQLKKKLAEEITFEATKPSPKENAGLINKGIQTMLRLTSENQMKLSDMADHKANILISVNAIIISVILSVLLRKLQTDAYLTIPTIIFLLVAVVTIVISILATRPKLSSGEFNDQDIIDKKTNLLFFGNFYKAPFEQYDLAMRKMMKDPDYLYGSVVKDIYHLAVVLGRKYRLIRLAYNIFMVGIIISVLAFAIATFFYQPDSVIINNATGTPL